MSDPTFTTHGDDALEARITAWVLGEASDFEVAELERLCEQRPELLVFKRRLEVLHGMLGEAETAAPDADWKLRPAKRLPIESILLGDRERQMEERIRRSGWRAITGIAACVVLTLVVAALLGNAFILKIDAPVLRETATFFMMDEAAPASAETALADESRKMVPFSSVAGAVPQELIEGTPKPMHVPGLVDPSREISAMLSEKKSNQPAPVAAPMVARKEKSARIEAKPLRAASAQYSGPEGLQAPSADLNMDGLASDHAPEVGNSIVANTATLDFGDTMDYVQSKGSFADASGRANLRRARGVAGGALADVDHLDAPTKAAESMSGIKLDAFADSSANQRPEIKIIREYAYSDADADLNGDRLSGKDAVTASRLATPHGRDGEEIRASLSLADDEARRRQAHYYRSANDHARVDLLSEADVAWEVQMPKDAGYPAKPQAPARPEMDALQKQIREQEAKVEERRKELSTIVRTKGIIYKGGDSLSSSAGPNQDAGARGSSPGYQQMEQEELARDETIKRGLDAQDYVDAKREFEADQSMLQALKLKQIEMALAESRLAQEEGAPHQDKALEWKRPVPVDGESAAAQEPYSTFSLNINDVSFKMAQAALAKGEMTDPEGIQVEQFYNAVDYGDPSPAAGEPVAGVVEQSLHPVIPGRQLVRIAVKTASAGRASQQPLRLTLLTDLSGSMAREDRRAAMEEALAGLAELLQPQDVINVIGFSRTPRLLAEGVRGNQAGKLAELMNLDANEGGTNLEEAIKLAGQLAIRHQVDGAQNRIVLFTDGAANLGDADPDSLAKRIKELRQDGIALDIAGIAADGLNDDLLGEMARNGNGRYYVVGKGGKDELAQQLAGAFRPAAENVKVQVHFNPERVGGYKLIGFEKDLLNKEDFRNDAVDAAEMAAEEAGVAIYQVETLPEGNGEIGDVSVRFRDVASGEMVERTWTISYSPVVPGLRDATPSMQLAALAMMAGQKLKGGPMAGAIDLDRYAGIQASVREHYGDGGRIGEVLQMIDNLK